MELTNGEIINSASLLEIVADAPLPPASSIRISRTLKTLQREQQTINKKRREIRDRYQATTAEGEPLFHPNRKLALQDQDEEEKLDLPEKVTEDHEYASKRRFIAPDKREELNEDLNSLFEDTVELSLQRIPADEIGDFEEPFYKALKESDQFEPERDEGESGFRPADIAPIEFIFPEDI